MMDDDITLSSSLSFYLKPFDNTVQSLLFCQMLRGREKSFQANTVFDNLQHNRRDIHNRADYVLPIDILTLCQRDLCGISVACGTRSLLKMTLTVRRV